jgi:hypothetical protein
MKPAMSRRFYEEVHVMKKFVSSVFVFLLTAALLTGAAASPASAAADHSGYTTKPWFASIATGELSNPLPDLFQNSAQYMIYRTGIFDPLYILAAHPNYQPDSDDPETAITTTLATAIQRYNPSGAKEDCTVGGTFQAPRSYVQTTTVSNSPYLKFSITFTTYNNYTGAVVSTVTFDPVYFSFDAVSPPPVPVYGF